MKRYISFLLIAVLLAPGMYGLFPKGAEAASCDTVRLSAVAYGRRNAAVMNLQACLILAGFSIPAGATGYYGPQTRAAVRAFYAASLSMPTWHGNSVGPLGRSTLSARLVSGGQNPHAGGDAWKLASSEAEFKKYLQSYEERGVYNTAIRGLGRGVVAETAQDGSAPTPAPSPSGDKTESSAGAPPRYSETNVQVAGIDEPDIVKTDGRSLFISQLGGYFVRPLPMPGVGVDGSAPSIAMPPYYDIRKTLVVNAYPLESLSIATSTIPETGEMLLVRDARVLIIFAHPNVVAYDVTDPKNPVKKWTYALSDMTSLLTARLHGGTVYLVTQTWLDSAHPCPAYPLVKGTERIIMPCTDIWVPGRIEPVNTTYTITTLNPVSGTTGKTLTFAGDANNTVVSMFANNLYLSYRSQSAITDAYLDFYLTQLTDYLPASTLDRIRAIRGYDISSGSKLHEIQLAVNAAVAALSANDRLKFDNDVHNRLSQYLETRVRQTDKTIIARVPTDSLTIAATGSIPGHLLNQFSLDEYNGNLRAAVTIGDQWSTPGGTRNDVYVLRPDLTIAGSITDLGLTERIYAARFIGDKGYLVTFRQIDPFYVLDLSNPTAPKRVGELKIPGYSAYLEPLSENMILGVGRDGSNVKLSIFDVSNPANPVEKAHYSLAESWTEVEGNHRAFLKDAKHEVFFIPAGNGGHVFSYAGGAITLKASVKGFGVKRAVFIEDNLYVIGDANITVLDEKTWQEVKKLDLPE